MINLLYLLLIPYLAIASRFHGGGFISASRFIRATVYALPYGLFFHPEIFHSMLLGGTISFLLAFLGKNIGHHNFWEMGIAPNDPNLSWLGKFIAFLGLKPDSLSFCTLGLAIKGAVMALGTLNPLAIIGHTVALPLAYFVGQRMKGTNETAEYISGGLDGAILSVILLLS